MAGPLRTCLHHPGDVLDVCCVARIEHIDGVEVLVLVLVLVEQLVSRRRSKVGIVTVEDYFVVVRAARWLSVG